MRQSMAGVTNLDARTQRQLVADVDSGKIGVEELRDNTPELVTAARASVSS